MDITIINLTITPDRFDFPKGVQTAILKFEGVVINSSSGPVKMTYELDDDYEICLINDSGNEVKSITWNENFFTSVRDFSYDVKLKVRIKKLTYTSMKTTLTATTKANKSSQTMQAIYYK